MQGKFRKHMASKILSVYALKQLVNTYKTS